MSVNADQAKQGGSYRGCGRRRKIASSSCVRWIFFLSSSVVVTVVTTVVLLFMLLQAASAWMLRESPPTATHHHHRLWQRQQPRKDPAGCLCLEQQQQHQEQCDNDNMLVEESNLVVVDTNKVTTRRRTFVQQASILLLQTSAFINNGVASATEKEPAAVQVAPSKLFTRQTDQFAYEFQPPPRFADPSQKPLKTHLDEVIIKASDRSGYQVGITVDPVRINSLTEFGTPEEVAAKVVLAEVNRDGVFDVKLMLDPFAEQNPSSGATFYQLNYLSSGKRGDKRFVAKFYIQNQKLYALTAQCREADYAALETEMLTAVASFRVL